MPTSLTTVVDPGLLAEMVEQRFVKKQTHPDDPGLTIYNYTQTTQFSRNWNAATLACRGLIVDEDGHVCARPFTKFFNLAEHPEGTLPDGPVHVTDKLDGSLGILYPTGGGYAIATRGSFASDQARHATQVWNDKYAPRFEPNPDWTYLFEIIYPGNRIVVDYGDVDDLFLLGAVDIATGVSVPLRDASHGWSGPVVPQMPYSTLGEALEAPDRDNSEGVVIHFLDADVRVKVKASEYVRLHRIVTGVTARRIWEALCDGVDLDPWLEAVPDECFTFVTTTRDDLLNQHAELTREVHTRYHRTLATLTQPISRKDFAGAVMAQADWPLHRALFNVHDGKAFDDLVWRQLKPADTTPTWGRSGDCD